MGYTHYFPQQRAFTNNEWVEITVDTMTLLDRTSIEVTAQIDGNEICFNGVGEDSHETFVVTREHNSEFNFCKTAHKPYDILVCAVLTIIDRHAPGVLDISSDGDEDDWQPGRELANNITR